MDVGDPLEDLHGDVAVHHRQRRVDRVDLRHDDRGHLEHVAVETAEARDRGGVLRRVHAVGLERGLESGVVRRADAADLLQLRRRHRDDTRQNGLFEVLLEDRGDVAAAGEERLDGELVGRDETGHESP